jgi:hypothetical protein
MMPLKLSSSTQAAPEGRLLLVDEHITPIFLEGSLLEADTDSDRELQHS